MTQSGKHYSNDFLVFATDYVHWPKRIEGSVLASDQFYQYQAARRLAHKLATIEKGRIFITVSFPETPNAPHQCGIAPIETTLILDDYLRQRGAQHRSGRYSKRRGVTTGRSPNTAGLRPAGYICDRRHRGSAGGYRVGVGTIKNPPRRVLAEASVTSVVSLRLPANRHLSCVPTASRPR